MFVLGVPNLDNHSHLCPNALTNGHVRMGRVVVRKQEGCYPVVLVL